VSHTETDGADVLVGMAREMVATMGPPDLRFLALVVPTGFEPVSPP
jgi:hypothetical protein